MWLNLSSVIVGIAVFLQVTDTHPIKKQASRHKVKLWKPKGDTREHFLRYHGLGQARFNKIKNDVIKLKSKIARKLGRQMEKSTKLDEFFDDILFTEEQVTYLLNLLKTRRKRKLVDFDVFPSNKWSQMPIKYKFDGSHDANDEEAIEQALVHWQNHTCVRFQRVDIDTPVSENHVLFTSQSGCWSYIGRSTVIPQQVNLQSPGCLYQMGVPVHEVGHALGFFHEQSRPDRDNYVDIIVSNIIQGKEHNFGKIEANVVNSMGVPYDYGSVMHYGSKSFADNTSIDTIKTKDKLYQLTLGQRNGLSDHDMKLANQAYCSDTCPSITCQKGGYVDPNNCTQCKCLDGFGGQYCDTVASGNGGCLPTDSGVLSVDSTDETCLESPNYFTGPYNDFDRCNWILKAPTGCTIDFYFKDDFGVYCRSETYKPVCTHWVEIKFERNLTLRGPRFCGSSRPNITETNPLTSEDNEAVVIFRSDAPTNWAGYRRGFKLCYKIGDPQCLTHGDVSTPSVYGTASTDPLTSTQSPSVSRTTFVGVSSTHFSTHTYDSTTDSSTTSQLSTSPDITTTQHIPSTVTTAVEHSTTPRTSAIPTTAQTSTSTTTIPTTTQGSTSTTTIPTTTQGYTSTTTIPTTTQGSTSTTTIPATTQGSTSTTTIPTTTEGSTSTTTIPTTTQGSTTTTIISTTTQGSTSTTTIPTTTQGSTSTTTISTTTQGSTSTTAIPTTTQGSTTAIPTTTQGSTLPPSTQTAATTTIVPTTVQTSPTTSAIPHTTLSTATTAETTEATTSSVLSTTANVVSTDTNASSAQPSTTTTSVTTEDPDQDCSDSSSSESGRSKSKCNTSSSSESEESTGSVESKESVESSQSSESSQSENSSKSRESKESEESSESKRSRGRKNKKSKRKPKKNMKGRRRYRVIE